MNRLIIDPLHQLNPISRDLLGHFVEQVPGNIPQGIYHPSHPYSDEDGFRTDLLEVMREVHVSQLRWAGNFSSTYHWMDGVGPCNQRPFLRNAAWQTTEDNAFGTAEFIKLCRKLNAEPVIGVNMGSGTAEEAMNWVEYCNGTGNTRFAQLRRDHGYSEPFHVRRWCLGNEMYAAWQFGHMDAAEYALQAERFATAMRLADPDIHLTAVGLETDPQWNWEVIKRLSTPKTRFQPGEWINALSAHYYPIGCAGGFENADYKTRTSLGAFFHERSVLMRNTIQAASNDAQSPVKVVWDEWNPMGDRDGTEFTLEMALWVSLILQSFIRDSAFVDAANYTFFIGGNGPIQPTAHGNILRHAEYYALKLYGDLLGDYLLSCHAEVPIQSVKMPMDRRWPQANQPLYRLRKIPLIDTVATVSKEQCSVFCINLDEKQNLPLEIILSQNAEQYSHITIRTLWHSDLHARNTENDPNRVSLSEQKLPMSQKSLVLSLPCHSLTAVTFWKK